MLSRKKVGAPGVCSGSPAAVLAREDVIDMKAKAGVFLRQAAVLAAVSRALADEMTRRRVHSGGFGAAEDRPRFSLEQPQERIGADHAFKLLQLRGGQETFSMFLGELIVASLSLLVSSQSDESLRELYGQALRQRAK